MIQGIQKKPSLSKILVIILLLCPLKVVSQSPVQDAYNSAIEHFNSGNYQDFLTDIRKADELRPNHPVISYRLAIAYALNNQPELAFEELKNRINYYAVDDFSKDSILQAQLNNAHFIKLDNLISDKTTPVETTSKAFEFEKEGFHAEGIMYSTYLDNFILSDARCGEVISVDANSSKVQTVLDLKEYGYWGGFGLMEDVFDHSIIWIATSALFNFCEKSDSTEGKAAIIQYDLNSKEVLFAFEPDGNHAFGDLTIDDNGDIYFTDSMIPILFKLDRSSMQVEEYVVGFNYWNLQGVIVTNEFLYVSDYISGIYQIDKSTKEIKSISESNERLRGTDGMYAFEDRLFLLQNGTTPKRISSIKLDSFGMELLNSFSLIESGVDDLDEPTLGTIKGGEFYFIYNSPWANYDQDGNIEFENWPKIRINSIKLVE